MTPFIGALSASFFIGAAPAAFAQHEYEYDELGRLRVIIDITNGDQLSYELDSTGNISAIVKSGSSGGNSPPGGGSSTIYVRNAAGQIQSPYTQSQQLITYFGGSTTLYHTNEPQAGPLHTSNIGYCDQNTAPKSGYAWTGNNCEMVKQ